MLDSDHEIENVYQITSRFVISKKDHKVYFDSQSKLTWELESDPKNPSYVKLEDILIADYCHCADNSCCFREKITFIDGEFHNFSNGECHEEIPKHTSLIIHYAVKGANHKWINSSVTMSNLDAVTVEFWVTNINKLLQAFKRPKKLLLFINPFGGKRKGLKIYESIVQPIFEMVHIQTDVVVTQRPNHIKDTMPKMFLEDYDGVVCLGGDGTFSEMINSVISCSCRKSVDDITIDETVIKPSLKVGFIPGGSTNTVAHTLHGTADVVTAVLFIILGDYIGLDVCSVHNNSRFVSFFISLLSYGYLGDVIQDSEKFRWMGPKRYDFSGFKRFMSNQGYDSEIGIAKNTQLESSDKKCFANCTRCKTNDDTSSDTTSTEWEIKRGKYLIVAAANISCCCDRSPNGISPSCHVGDGCMDIILVKHTSLLNNLRLLLTLSSKNKQIYDLPFVEVYRTKEFTFRALPFQPECPSKLSVWNCDGELILDQCVKVRSHCQLLKLFYRSSNQNSFDEN